MTTATWIKQCRRPKAKSFVRKAQSMNDYVEMTLPL